MSGGHFDYENMRIEEWIRTIKKDKYDTKKLEKLLGCISRILHSYDWFMCGDIGESEWKKRYYEELQKIKKIVK